MIPLDYILNIYMLNRREAIEKWEAQMCESKYQSRFGASIVIKNPPFFNIFLQFFRVTNRSSIVKCSSVAYKIIASNFLFNFPISTDEDSKNSISRSYNLILILQFPKILYEYLYQKLLNLALPK